MNAFYAAVWKYASPLPMASLLTSLTMLPQLMTAAPTPQAYHLISPLAALQDSQRVCIYQGN